MAQAVEATNAPPPLPPRVAEVKRGGSKLPPPLPPRRPPDAVPAVVPVTQPSFRGQMGELAGSMFLTVVLSLLATLPWVALLGRPDRPGNRLELLGSLFFLTVAVSWAILLPTKFWEPHLRGAWLLTRMRVRKSELPVENGTGLPPTSDGIGRRLCMAGLGLAIGVGVMWLEGWHPKFNDATSLSPGDAAGLGLVDDNALTPAAGYLTYFGLSLGAVRWWRLTDRRRKHWFSLFPVLAAGFWALLLLVFWPANTPMYGAAALVMASAIVQWVSPWEPPPPPPPKRLRLRYA
jgi:hypothetical protein